MKDLKPLTPAETDALREKVAGVRAGLLALTERHPERAEVQPWRATLSFDLREADALVRGLETPEEPI